MSESTTVAVNGCVYDMGSTELAREADAWVYDNPGDVTSFEDHFPDAQIMTTPLGSTLRQQ